MCDGSRVRAMAEIRWKLEKRKPACAGLLEKAMKLIN
jgi:hypothetical protein